MRREIDVSEFHVPQHGFNTGPVGPPPVRAVPAQFGLGIEDHCRTFDLRGVKVSLHDQGFGREASDALEHLEWMAKVVKHTAEQYEIEPSDCFQRQVGHIDISDFDAGRDVRAGQFDCRARRPRVVGPHPVIRSQHVPRAAPDRLDRVEAIPASDIENGLPFNPWIEVDRRLRTQKSNRRQTGTDDVPPEINLVEPA